MKKVLITFALPSLAGMLIGCGDASNATSSSQDDMHVEPTNAPPSPNYVEHKNGVYYYTTEVSDNDRANGKAAGDVVEFRYLGKNSEGDNVLTVSDTSIKITCSDPCRIIHTSNGESFEFTPSSVVGAAFVDAMNGLLEVDNPKK